jgi:two-component system, chemotaxis family, chemotaxis protein CheY
MANILVIDDSALSRRILRRILEAEGHLVREAGDGMVALEQYLLDQPDLVLLDMTMRGMHGLDVLSKLREMDPQARVIVATADIQRSTRELVDAAGGSGFVSKPFEAERVLSAVNTVLGGGGAWN